MGEPVHLVRSRRLRAAATVLALAGGALAGTAGASPVGAGAPPDPSNRLTWKISEHAWTNGSLDIHEADAPAVVTAFGFRFGEAEDASYDATTGALDVTFPGAMQIGNIVRGNYHIRFADLSVSVDEAGDGDLDADVSYALPDGAGGHDWSTPVRATVADFTLDDGDVSVVDDVVSFTVTPDFVPRTDLDPNPEGHRQFPQPLIDALAPAVPSLLGHFQETGAAADRDKAPAPLSVSFEVDGHEAFVGALYRALLNRDPGSGEVDYWTGRLDGGTSRLAVAESVARSPEGRTWLVDTAYLRVLRRPADQAGVDYWTGRLATGLTPERLISSIALSAESRASFGDADGLAEVLYELHVFRSGSDADLAYWASRGISAHTVTAFGRLPEATTAMVRTVGMMACGPQGGTGMTDEQAAELAQRWTSHRGDTSRLIGATLALVCPEGWDLRPV